MKNFLSIVKGLRFLLKWAGLIIIIFEIIEFAANKIEAYATGKKDTEKKHVENGGTE